MNPQTKGNVSESMSRFCNCLAIIGAFFASPYILRHAKPYMYDYLLEFGGQTAYYGSWGFVIVCILGTYFGLSMLGELNLRDKIYFLAGRRGIK